METLGPAPARHEASGELVHDDDLAVLYRVVLLALVEGMRPQCLQQMVQERHLTGLVEVLDVQEFLGLRDSLLGQGHRTRFLVHGVVEVAPESRDHPVHREVQIGGFLGGATDDEWGARFVDQDRIHFVHDGVVEKALHLLAVAVAFGARVGAMDEILGTELHVVPQVIESELVVGAVGDVGGVGVAPLLVAQVVLDDPHAEAEELVETTHPFRVAAGEVVVHGHDVDALVRKGVENGRQRRHQGLALAGLHFGDSTPVQNGAPEELHVEMAHSQGAPRSFAANRKHLGHEVLKRLAVVSAGTERSDPVREPPVLKFADCGLESPDLGDQRFEPLQFPVGFLPDDLGEEVLKQSSEPGKPVNLAVCGQSDVPDGGRDGGWRRSRARENRPASSVDYHHSGSVSRRMVTVAYPTGDIDSLNERKQRQRTLFAARVIGGKV